MTYIDYLNTFNRWLESHTLPTGAQLLYFRLLNVFNAAGWPEDVRVDTLKLMWLMGSSTSRTAWRARDELVEAGLITVQKGKRGAPALYHLNDVKKDVKKDGKKGGKKDVEKESCVDFVTNNVTNNGTNPVTNPVTSSDTNPVTNNEFLLLNDIKTKTKTKTKTETKTTTTAVAVYLSKINPSASPMSIDELKGYVGQMGDEVCIRAMDIALDAKKATWPYIRGILRKWQGMGVTCLADIAEKEAQHGHHGTDSTGNSGRTWALDEIVL